MQGHPDDWMLVLDRFESLQENPKEIIRGSHMSIELITEDGCLVKATFTGNELRDLYKLYRELNKEYEKSDGLKMPGDLACFVNNTFSPLIHTWLGAPKGCKENSWS
jgi:hypothetical protein